MLDDGDEEEEDEEQLCEDGRKMKQVMEGGEEGVPEQVVNRPLNLNFQVVGGEEEDKQESVREEVAVAGNEESSESSMASIFGEDEEEEGEEDGAGVGEKRSYGEAVNGSGDGGEKKRARI